MHYVQHANSVVYFINVGSSLAKNITTDVDPLIYVKYYDKSIDIPKLSTDEIISFIASMTNSAAIVIKQLIAYFVHLLTLLINK